MKIEDQVSLLKTISYKEVFFHLAEKGTLEDLKAVVDKVGPEILGQALCDKIDVGKYHYDRYKKAVNDKNQNILEVLLYNKRPLEFLKYLVEKITERRGYSQNKNLLDDCYRDWHNSEKGFLLELIVEEANIDYYDYMKNKGFITRNEVFVKSLLTEKKFFKHVTKDFDFDKAFESFESNNSSKLKLYFLDFMTENKTNENLINNIKLLKNRGWFVSELLLECIKEQREEIYFLFKNVNVFSISTKKYENIFKALKNEDEKIASFLKKSNVDLLYKDKDGSNMIDMMKKSGIVQKDFPLTSALIEKAIINKQVLESTNTVNAERISKRL